LQVIDDKECGRRAEEAKARGEPHFYMMEMAPGLIIDARSKGNLARLLNSSCDPNCETQKWHDAGNSEVSAAARGWRLASVGWSSTPAMPPGSYESCRQGL
jgi:hypothetical protein